MKNERKKKQFTGPELFIVQRLKLNWTAQLNDTIIRTDTYGSHTYAQRTLPSTLSAAIYDSLYVMSMLHTSVRCMYRTVFTCVSYTFYVFVWKLCLSEQSCGNFSLQLDRIARVYVFRTVANNELSRRVFIVVVYTRCVTFYDIPHVICVVARHTTNIPRFIIIHTNAESVLEQYANR